MPKPKIMKISVLYRREIVWLKSHYGLVDLFDLIKHLYTKSEQPQLFLRKQRAQKIINDFTSRYIEKSDPVMLTFIKSVFIFEKMDIFDACTDILGVSTLQAFKMLENWFEGYFDELFYMIPDDAVEGHMLLEGYQTA